MIRKISLVFVLFLLLCTFAACASPSAPPETTPNVSDASQSETSAPEVTTPEQTNPEQTTAETTTPDPYATQRIKVKEMIDYINVGGRHTVKHNGVTFDWTCAYIEFNADCEGDVKIKFSEASNLYISVIIDGVMQDERICVKSASTVTVASGLEAGQHTIRIVRGNGASSSGGAKIGEIIINGSLLMPPAKPEKLIEFVGDSITCGYGNLIPVGEKYSQEGTDPTKAFAYLTAWSLSADYSMVAVSGIAIAGKMYHDITMSDVYNYTNYYRDDNDEYSFERPADLVVVNLGTNDETTNTWGGGLDSEVFKGKVRELLALIREKNGDCNILWVHDMMSDGYFRYTAEVLAELGGEENGYYSIALVRDTLAADGHCSVTGHAKSANALARYIYDNNLLD